MFKLFIQIRLGDFYFLLFLLGFLILFLMLFFPLQSVTGFLQGRFDWWTQVSTGCSQILTVDVQAYRWIWF